MGRLSDKLCIITGAGRGIGAGIARAFAAEGAGVVVTDKVKDLAASVAQEIGAAYMTGAELTVDGGLLAGSAAAPSTD